MALSSVSRAVQQDIKADERGDAPQHDGIHRAPVLTAWPKK